MSHLTERWIIRRRCTHGRLNDQRPRKQKEGVCSVNAVEDCSFV
jgi:hypothetical protein